MVNSNIDLIKNSLKDLESFDFNTIVSDLMKFNNALSDYLKIESSISKTSKDIIVKNFLTFINVKNVFHSLEKVCHPLDEV